MPNDLKLNFEDHFLSKRVGISFGDIEEPFLSKSKVKSLCQEVLKEAFSFMVEKGFSHEKVEPIAGEYFLLKFGTKEKPARKAKRKKDRVP